MSGMDQQSRAEQVPHQLSESASILLDLVRFTAAIGVVASHCGNGVFGTGWNEQSIWGDLAVPIFFVLSGFIIRFVTRSRDGNPRDYSIDRASRIYSVVLPAMIVTLLCSGLCMLLDHDRFVRDWSQFFVHPIARLALNLTFLSQIWGFNSIPFINSPFWSLGYECIYYVFYGFVIFLRGWKRTAACIAFALLVGPQVLFLLPLWWLGCWMYDAYHRVRSRRASMIALAILAFWFAASALARFAGIGKMPFDPAVILFSIANLTNPLTLLGQQIHRATMFAYAAGIVGALLLFLSLLAVELISVSRKKVWKQNIRRIADGTFVVYLFHYPVMLLLAYAGFFHYGHNFGNIAVIAVMICMLIVLARPLDALKRQMRRGLRAALPDGVPAAQLPLESN
jgi:peptidoglycan/LPS O-acetylase OafA/YrhL